MTRQRLADAASAAAPGTSSFGRDLAPGEERTVTTREGKVITIVRTSRPYVFDLRDAYNDAMSDGCRRRGLEWFVDGNGNLRLGSSESAIRQMIRLEEQRRKTASARALQRSFEDLGA